MIESTENDAEKTITVSVPISARNMNDELEMGMDDVMLVKTGQNDLLTDDEVRKESGNSKAIIFGDKLVCPYCLRKFQRFRERDNHVKMIHEKSSVKNSVVNSVKNRTITATRNSLLSIIWRSI